MRKHSDTGEQQTFSVRQTTKQRIVPVGSGNKNGKPTTMVLLTVPLLSTSLELARKLIELLQLHVAAPWSTLFFAF